MNTDTKETTEAIAYIDGANLQNAVSRFDWDFDYARFRVWLKDKFKVVRAYIFIGRIPKYQKLYDYLESAGYTLIFKEVTYNNGKPKGNVDAELVLKGVRDTFEQNIKKAVLVSSDGDYKCMVEFFKEKSVDTHIVSPYAPQFCSLLLKRTDAPIYYLVEKKHVLMKENEKAPDRDGTL